MRRANDNRRVADICIFFGFWEVQIASIVVIVLQNHDLARLVVRLYFVITGRIVFDVSDSAIFLIAQAFYVHHPVDIDGLIDDRVLRHLVARRLFLLLGRGHGHRFLLLLL